MNDVELVKKWKQSPISFIEDIWNLTPEIDNKKFVKGKNISWQQKEILEAVESALRDETPRRISIASGHGIGKTATLSWLLLWFLFCHREAQVACTAPTTSQMYDVLWKEVAKWMHRMPPEIAILYEWTTNHIRIKESPETWFARAKTARKENPEALAGMHGEHVMFLVDEASGVPEEIYKTAEGALTDKNILVLLISNPTRLIGTFYNSHHRDKSNWKTFQYTSHQSPLVDEEYNTRIATQHGEDSDEYRIRVQGIFPKADSVDEQGYVPLFLQSDIRYVEDSDYWWNGKVWVGVDPSGEGDDKTAWVARDRFVAKIIGEEKISNEKQIARRTLSFMDMLETSPDMIAVDDFGIGAKSVAEINLAGTQTHKTLWQLERVRGINVGEVAEDTERFLNKRAEFFFRLKEWIRQGGEFIKDERWQELLNIRYRREMNGKLRIMSKRDMAKQGLKSPNFADAMMLTFFDKDFNNAKTGKKVYDTPFYETNNNKSAGSFYGITN